MTAYWENGHANCQRRSSTRDEPAAEVNTRRIRSPTRRRRYRTSSETAVAALNLPAATQFSSYFATLGQSTGDTLRASGQHAGRNKHRASPSHQLSRITSEDDGQRRSDLIPRPHDADHLATPRDRDPIRHHAHTRRPTQRLAIPIHGPNEKQKFRGRPGSKAGNRSRVGKQ